MHISYIDTYMNIILFRCITYIYVFLYIFILYFYITYILYYVCNIFMYTHYIYIIYIYIYIYIYLQYIIFILCIYNTYIPYIRLNMFQKMSTLFRFCKSSPQIVCCSTMHSLLCTENGLLEVYCMTVSSIHDIMTWHSSVNVTLTFKLRVLCTTSTAFRGAERLFLLPC